MFEGIITGVEINNLTSLLLRRKTVGAVSVPQFSQKAACLSLEMASLAYEWNIEPWRNAGYFDFSFLAENYLLTGAHANGNGKLDQYLQNLAHMKASSKGIVSQVLGAVRQREECDSCKAVVMAFRQSTGRYAILISFMGTGSRLYDWISNFRLSQQEMLHTGFLQLARQFEKQEKKILFPQLSAALKTENLTLHDILAECMTENSRFDLWLSGHSQGGAIMQIVMYHWLERGMRSAYLTGYSFASPGVASLDHPAAGRKMPMYHIINSDDVIPRLGGAVHLGECMRYPADEIMRMKCCEDSLKYASSAYAYQLAAGVINGRSALEMMLGVLDALILLPDEQTHDILRKWLGSTMPEWLVNTLTGHTDGYLRGLRKKMIAYYRDAQGEDADPLLTAAVCCGVKEQLDREGMERFLAALMLALRLPHRLFDREYASAAAYTYIVKERFYLLEKVIWRPGKWMYGCEASRRVPVCAIRPGRYHALSKLIEQRKCCISRTVCHDRGGER